MRFVFSLVVLGVALHATTVSAQSPAWGTTTTQSLDADELAPPVEDGPTNHVVREKLLATGISLLAVGYVASLAWGSFYLDHITLGPLSCNDQYAGWHFVPIVGPVLGMVSGASCIHDSLHFEEGLLPVIFAATQLAGLIMTIVGAVGRDVPSVLISADANGGYFSLRGTF